VYYIIREGGSFELECVCASENLQCRRTLRTRSHGKQSTQNQVVRHAEPARVPLQPRSSVLEKWFNPPNSMASCP